MAVPKVNGADVELGNTLIGEGKSWEARRTERGSGLLFSPSYGRSGGRAARLLLEEIGGYPSARTGTGWNGSGHGGNSRWGASSGWHYYDPQDVGRRWLPQNGSSVYIDLDHLEITLPEVVSAYDHVAAFHAMLRLVEKARQRAQAKLPAGQRLLVTANNSDGCSHSWGGHLNVMISRHCFEDLFERKPHQLGFLGSHLATAIVYTGQGKVGSENGAPAVDYQISQRADFIEKLTGIETTYRRPIVNSRREGHTGPLPLERLHLIPFDTNLCSTSILLRVGTTQLVLAMIEDGICETRALLDDPVTAIGELSRDPSLRKRARTADGRNLTAVEIQEAIARAARRYVDEGRAEGVVPRAREIVDLWEDTLEKLRRRDFAALARRLDWVLKLLLLDREIQRGGHDWKAPQIKLCDHLYASLDPQEGTFWRLESQGLIERMVSEEEKIAFFRRNPPEETRAWGRAHLLRRFGREITEIDWSRMETRDPEYRWQRRALSMPDPLGFNRRQVEGSLEMAASAWEAFELLGEGGEGPFVAGREAGPEKEEEKGREGETIADRGVLPPSICALQSGTPSGDMSRNPEEDGGMSDERKATHQEK